MRFASERKILIREMSGLSNLYRFFKNMKGKRVLGINPPVFDFAFFDLWAKPLGLLYLLQQLREQQNEVFLIDCVQEARAKEKGYGRFRTRKKQAEKPEVFRDIPRKYYHFGLDEEELLLRFSETPSPDMILLTSGMTYWYPGVFWTVKLVRRAFPKVPIYLGGIYPRLCPDHASLTGAEGIQTEPFPVNAGYPALDLYRDPGHGVGVTSWGCPLGCDYCASKLLSPSYRRRPVREVLREIAFQVNRCGINDYAFYDDALLLEKEQFFYPLCDEIKKRFPGLAIHTPNGLHVQSIDATCARTLKSAGVKTLRLSLESVDPKVLEKSSSKVSRRQYEQALEHLMNAGFEPDDLETYILVGLPGQDIEGVRMTIEFVRKRGGSPKLAQFSPIPGTRLFPRALGNVPDLAEEPLLQNNSVFCTYISNQLTPKALQDLKDLAYC